MSLMYNPIHLNRQDGGSSSAQAILARFRELLGSENKHLPPSFFDARNSPRKLIQDLWTSYAGMNWISSQIFVEDVCLMGDYIMSLLPIMTYENAISKCKLVVAGDEVIFDEWSFATNVLAEKSKRHPGRILTSTRDSKSRCFTHRGVSFQMPMNWPTESTLQQVFKAHLRQMNRSIQLTWQYQILQTINFEGIIGYNREVESKLPYTQRDFEEALHVFHDRCFGINKEGIGMKGYEARAKKMADSRGIPNNWDACVLSNGMLHSCNLRPASKRQYFESGNTKISARDLDTEGRAFTSVYGIPVYESKEFKLDGQAYTHDPTHGELIISQRFLMLPQTAHANDFNGYSSFRRSIEIVDGESREFHVVTIMDALKNSGLFGGANGNLTPLGRSVFERLCRPAGGGGGGGGYGGGYGGGDGKYGNDNDDGDDSGGGGHMYTFGDLYEHADDSGMLKLVAKNLLEELDTGTAEIKSDIDFLDYGILAQVEEWKNQQDAQSAQAILVYLQAKYNRTLDHTGTAMGVVNNGNNSIQADIVHKAYEEKARRLLGQWGISTLYVPFGVAHALKKRANPIFRRICAVRPKTRQQDHFINSVKDMNHLNENEIQTAMKLWGGEEKEKERKKRSRSSSSASSISSILSLSDPNDGHSEDCEPFPIVDESQQHEFFGRPLTLGNFQYLFNRNIPIPLSFLLFRMNIRVETGSCVFMKTGPETGVCVIKDGAILYEPDASTYAVSVNARFTAGTFIRNSANLTYAPHVASARYLGGAGVKIKQPHDQNDEESENDILAIAVRYNYKPARFYTDIKGTVSPDICTTTSTEPAFETADCYEGYLYDAQDYNPFIIRTNGSLPRSQYPRIATQSSQRVWEPSLYGTGSGGLTKVITGKGPLGEFVTPNHFNVLQGGGSNEFHGYGMRSSVSGRDMYTTSKRPRFM